VCLRNEMEIQSKTLDALLEKAEQVIRLLEVSDDTKCEPSHKSEVVDQLQADNYGKGKSRFVRISVVKWLKISTEWVMKHQESSKRMEEENLR
jgi:hypothetical protein